MFEEFAGELLWFCFRSLSQAVRRLLLLKLRLSWAKMLFDVDGLGVEIQAGLLRPDANSPMAPRDSSSNEPRMELAN